MAIAVGIHNFDLTDLIVSVLDLNLGGASVLNNQRINEGDTVPIAVQEDGNGRGNIQWTVQRIDDPDRPAQRTVEVTDGMNVDVTANFE
jgi:hypothetical protein